MLNFLAGSLGSMLDPANLLLMALVASFAYRREVILLGALAVAAFEALIMSSMGADIWSMWPQHLLGALAAGFAIRETWRWLRRPGKPDVDVS